MAALAAFTLCFAAAAPAQTSATAAVATSGSAETTRAPRARAQAQFTTASAEARFARTIQPDLEAAGVSAAKIEQYRQADIAMQAARAAGTPRQELAAQRAKAEELLSADERAKYQQIRRDRVMRRNGNTTGTPAMAGEGAGRYDGRRREGARRGDSTTATVSGE